MQDWITLEEARDRPGLRLVLTAGVPGPWGESAKNLLRAKSLDYARAPQIPGESEDVLRAWTAQTSAPVLVYEDERPRASWVEILYQVERLAPEPCLIPDDPEDRVRMLGLCHEVCGDQGFGWQRRLTLLHPMLSSGAGAGVPELLGAKYGYSPEAGEAAPQRTAEILRTLSQQLLAQREAGRSYFVGEQLTALDLYWAAFAAMIEPLPDEQCAMPRGLRAAYTLVDPEVRKAADPVLLEHRDAIYRNHLELPLDL